MGRELFFCLILEFNEFMRILKFAGVVGFIGVIFSLAFYFGWNSAEIKITAEEAGANLALQDRQARSVAESLPIEPKKELTLIFVGDIMLSRGVERQIEKHSDYNYPFLKIADYLKGADLVFGNLEGPISDRGKNQGSIYSFRDNPKAVEGLTYAGFDVLSLANNHIMDWGRDALSDAVDILDKNGIKTVGAGKNYDEANKPVILEVNGTKIAFLAYTNLLPKSLSAGEDVAGVSDFNLDKIKNKIEEAKKNADLVLISAHWGEEYQPKAGALQKKIAHELIDGGADLIIGHHPHVPEEVEQYGGGWIFYSLGNFVFDQNFSKETMGGLMVEVKIKDKMIEGVMPIAVKISPTFQPYIPTD